jgi:hypothetical protein
MDGEAWNNSILDNILEPSIFIFNSKFENGKHGPRLKHILIPIVDVTKQYMEKCLE